MKRKFVTSSLAAALTLGSFCTYAQTQPADRPSTQQSGAADQNQVDPNDQSKGQQLVGSQKPTAAEAQGHPSPPTTGQDKSTGNNLIAEDNGKMQNAGTPSFQSLDSEKRGYLTLADAKSQAWLKDNFARCDSNHDGRLTQREYADCEGPASH